VSIFGTWELTGHDDIDAARDRIDLQGLQIPQNIESTCPQVERPRFRICASPVAGINVSSTENRHACYIFSV
jgi:hypothetical protein